MRAEVQLGLPSQLPAMADAPACFPGLSQRVVPRNNTQRAMELGILLLLLPLLLLRLISLNQHGTPWALAFLFETWYTFQFLLSINAKWNPVEYINHPHNLSSRVKELPAVDMLVTTADPILEPPILTVNTVLSLLAVDYPTHKLACYVSDDAASPLTFFSLLEALKLARSWVPFCKAHGVPLRAPFRYFAPENGETHLGADGATEFQLQRQRMKVEYEKLVQRINDAADKPGLLRSMQELEAFSGVQVNNHGSMVKVIWENKNGLGDGLPHLVYVAREKRPKHSHHNKAGAMNVLARVSGVLTNAPFMLNVDCDMYAHNPQVVMHAMCSLLGFNETDSGFVQSPQFFYTGPNVVMQIFYQYMTRGIAGQGVLYYLGTGCFHRRKVIYGAFPRGSDADGGNTSSLPEMELRKRFGDSEELVESVAETLYGAPGSSTGGFSTQIHVACRVAGCTYEQNTEWGKMVGWMYGSVLEDVLTGMTIHSRGWRSVLCAPDPPAFLGCAPFETQAVMAQQRRWTTGLLENLLEIHRLLPAIIAGRLGFRGFLVYLLLVEWGLGCIRDLCYVVLLPAYCIITNSSFLPKGPALCLPLAFILAHCAVRLWEFIQCGGSARTWWIFRRMDLTISATAGLFGVLSVGMKLVGLSEPVFEITQKGQEAAAPSGGMSFYESAVFVPATALTLVHLAALGTAVLGLRPPPSGGESGAGVGEVGCSLWAVTCLWPFVEGLFRRGPRGIPGSVVWKSAGLALLLVHGCRWTTLT